MKVFDDMTFEGTPEALANFIERLDQSPQVGSWTRDQEAEQGLAGYGGADPNTCRCFRMKGQNEFQGALLWLFAGYKGEGTWRVSNIVPAAQNAAFSDDTYYSFLTSFREATLPFANEVGVKISVPQLEVGPEYWLTEKQVKLLDSFSQRANRSTGSSHALDQKRWNDFVIAVHNDQTPVSGHELKRILVEHEHWSERIAQELANDFDKQLDLLRDFAKSA